MGTEDEWLAWKEKVAGGPRVKSSLQGLVGGPVHNVYAPAQILQFQIHLIQGLLPAPFQDD